MYEQTRSVIAMAYFGELLNAGECDVLKSGTLTMNKLGRADCG